MKNAAGGIEEVMSIGTDITERRQAEEALRLREEQFRRILDNMQDAYFQVDREGRLVNVSPSAVRLYGYGSVEEMIGMPAACLYKDAAMRDKVIEELRRNGRVHDLTGEGRKKDGSCFWVSLNAQIHYGANGQIMGSEGFVRDTSERRRAEEALRASENRYRYFVEQTMEGFYRLEADGPIPIDRPVDEVVQSMYRHLYIAECNEAFARMYGYAGVQQIVGRRFVDLHGGTDIPENLEALGAFVRANCQMLNAETREMDKNGNEVVFSNNSVGIIENGLLVSTWGTQLDITAQKRAEEALQESEQRFRMVLEGSRLGFWDWDIQSNKVQRNERWAEMLGYTLEEVRLTVKQWSDLIHPDDRAAARASISDHLQDKTPMHRAEYRMRTKDGHYKWILDQARIMMRDAQGKPLRMCGTHTDISERKQVEDALQKQLVALSQPLDNPANIQFTDLFSLKDLQRIQDEFAEATGVASIITCPDGTPITKPSKFCRLCNDIIRQTDIGRANCFKSDAAIGRHSFDGPTCQPCLSGGLWDAGASISIGGRHVANWLIGQVRNEELDESQILHYAEVIGADRDEFRRALAEVPVMSKAQFDKVARILFTLANELSLKAYQNIQQARFITEHKQTEVELVQHREHLEEQVQRRTTELAEARDQAQAASRAKSAFLANMSHELRTPLNAVLGFAQIMSSDRTISAQAKENLSIILRSGEHLLALINDILDLSKIEAGRSNLDLHDVDLDLLIQDVADMMRFKAETKGLRLVIEQSAEFPRFASVDPGKFRQILVNLVGNGVKFTKAGQVAVRLDAKPAPDGYLLNIEVRDTGIGIAKSDFELVFRPFEQIGAKTIEGTGLGLAITRQYVQMLGGEISIDSELGKGSCFHFTLPVGRVGSDSAQALAGHRAPVGIGSPTAEIRLLIVEDQPENRLLIRCFLEPFGFQLCEATNGQEAVAAFEEWRPHLIFMDRRMPVMDGMEAIRRIRMLPEGRGTVIVAVSAHSFKEEQQEMLDAGCDDFLGKPFGLTDLLALLKKHLHLDLVYGDVAAASPAGRRPLTSADLQSVPVAELRNLRRWALEAQADDLMAWANGPNDLSPEARQVLAGLLQEYRFDVLTQAIDPLLPVQKPGESPAEA